MTQKFIVDVNENGQVVGTPVLYTETLQKTGKLRSGLTVLANRCPQYSVYFPMSVE